MIKFDTLMDDALISAIIAAPDDDAPRLVWADREGGARGELVVVQCAIASGRRDLSARERELLAQLAKPGDRYERGFLEHGVFRLDDLSDQGAMIFAAHPLLRSIAISDFEGVVTEDASAAALYVRQNRFARAFAAFPPGRVDALTASAFIREAPLGMAEGLRTFGAELATLIRDAGTLKHLRELTLIDSGFRYARHLGGLHPHLRVLRTLRLRGTNDLSWEDAAHVVNSLTSLRHFGYEIADWDDAGEDLRPFLALVEPGRLETFELATSDVPQLVAAIRAYPAALSALTTLRLRIHGDAKNPERALRAALPSFAWIELA